MMSSDTHKSSRTPVIGGANCVRKVGIVRAHDTETKQIDTKARFVWVLLAPVSFKLHHNRRTAMCRGTMEDSNLIVKFIAFCK
ncbi:Hypothetical protein CINCED_3A012040 [Cinara cedri]|uniref:Uncharacterized protein n=1 Tax=Cinara cedri TaxID=506608 RepID=A0A5E4M9Y8_9HEMI|nr:Hypothetical protein CINCED_3A012040 [Cinara cedri]